MEKKNNVGRTALIVLLLIVTIASLVLATYAWAKYTEKVGEGTATAEVAKWNVTATVDGTAQYTKEFTHVVPTQMAPGTSGVIPVSVKLNDSEVCAKYEIFVEEVTGKPTNVKFYEATKQDDGTYTKGTEITVVDGSAAAITGYLELTGDNAVNNAEEGTRYIMWDWPYETPGGDEADTTDGKADGTMNVKVRVVATQVNPEDAADIDNN